MLPTALLQADLHHAASIAHGGDQRFALGQRVRDRLLAIHVFARAHGVHRRWHVPVIGSGDHHGVNVFAVEQLAVVEVIRGVRRMRGLHSQAVRLIDVAYGDDFVGGRSLTMPSKYSPRSPVPMPPMRMRSLAPRIRPYDAAVAIAAPTKRRRLWVEISTIPLSSHQLDWYHDPRCTLMRFDDNSLSIGKTPLIKLNRVTGGSKATVLAKIEGRNPAYSVKCRIGASMVWDAEKRGVLIAWQGIGGAYQRKHRDRPRVCGGGPRLPHHAHDAGDHVSGAAEGAGGLRRQGGSDGGRPGMKGAIAKAEEIHASDPGHYVLLQQFKNPANPAIHFRTTGPEIWDDTAGAVDVFVSGIGTGGTITGVSRYIKQDRGKPILSVGVEPAASPVISQTLRGEPLKPGPHKIQGIGAGIIPETLDLSVVDRVETVSNEESIEMARRLAREEGILSGISSGAATAVALRLAAQPEFAGKTIVVVLPDSGERYLSSVLFEGIG